MFYAEIMQDWLAPNCIPGSENSSIIINNYNLVKQRPLIFKYKSLSSVSFKCRYVLIVGSYTSYH